MTTHYLTVYRKDTGQIVSTGLLSCEDEVLDINFALRADQFGGADHDIIDAPADPELTYVVMMAGEAGLADRPALQVTLDKTEIAADGEDVATLTGLPNPCSIIIDDTDPLTETTVAEVTGGGFEFVTQDPGVYTFEVRGRFPFLPLKFTVTAL